MRSYKKAQIHYGRASIFKDFMIR